MKNPVDLLSIRCIILAWGVLHYGSDEQKKGSTMSKGSKIVPVRVQESLHKEIVSAVESANLFTRGELYTVSSWIRHQIVVKLKHLKRSSDYQRGKSGATVMVPIAQGRKDDEGTVQRDV